jgi:hypothetical protein
MKPETKNKLVWVLCVPIAVLLIVFVSVELAATWNDKFATKEFVSTHYLKKDLAEIQYARKLEAAVQTETIKNIDKSLAVILNGVFSLDERSLILEKKLDRHLILDSRNNDLLSELSKQPPPDQPPPPIKIANGE